MLLPAMLFLALISSDRAGAQEESYEPPPHTELSFANFTVIIYDFQVYNLATGYDGLDTLSDIRKDTVVIEEWPFNHISGKLVYIEPKNNGERYKVSYSLHKSLLELYDERVIKDYDSWDKTRYRRNWFSKFKLFRDSAAYYFRMPELYDGSLEQNIKKRFEMRDTLIIPPGEMPPVATLMYKAKPIVFDIPEACIRIERYRGRKRIETKYIWVVFTRGC